VQEERARTKRREVKEIEEAKEVKGKKLRTPSPRGRSSVPPHPLLPLPPPFPQRRVKEIEEVKE
jgi:hypothetical protein